MKAKWIFLLLVFTLLLPHVVQSQSKIVVTLDALKTPEPRRFGYFYLDRGFEDFSFDSGNHAECVLEGLDYVYLNVRNGFDENKVVYAESGDRIKLEFDGVSLYKTLVIKGGHESVQKYLDSLRLNPMPYDIFKLEFPRFIDTLNKFIAHNLKPLEACAAEINKSSRKFIEVEKNRIRCSFLPQILNYPRFHAQMNEIKDFRPGQDFYDTLASFIRENPLLLGLGEYQTLIVENIFFLLQRTREIKTPEERISALVEYFQANFKNDRVRQFFIHKLITAYVAENGIRTTPQFDSFYRSNVIDKDLVEQYQTIYDGWNSISPGQQMPDFLATDASGKEYTLKDFEGKYLCIFLWPNIYQSIKEYGNFRKFEPLFREKNISLVSLSLERKTETWKTALEEMSDGTHLQLRDVDCFRDACHYNPSNMHQVILVAPDGKIIEIDAPLPSSLGFEEFIRLYVNI